MSARSSPLVSRISATTSSPSTSTSRSSRPAELTRSALPRLLRTRWRQSPERGQRRHRGGGRRLRVVSFVALSVARACARRCFDQHPSRVHLCQSSELIAESERYSMERHVTAPHLRWIRCQSAVYSGITLLNSSSQHSQRSFGGDDASNTTASYAGVSRRAVWY